MSDNENDQKSQAARFINPDTGAPDANASAGSVTSRGTKTDASQTPRHESGKPTTQNVNMGDRSAQGNIGGRNPGESNKNSGDQDSTQSRADMDTTDPMRGRLPDQLDKITDHETSKGVAQRDP